MIRRLAGDRRGSVTLVMAGLMVLLLGMTALAVDVGGAYLKARALQGAADAAALAAAGSLATAQAAATAAVRDNGWTNATVQVQQGQYARDPAVPVASRFTAGAMTPNAARVTVTARAPLRFAGALFGRRSVTITRRATAMRVNQAAFTLGTRIAGLDNGLANALLGQLVGGTVSLSVGSYNALLGADVGLFATLDALRTRLNLTGASYDQVLAANVTVPVLLRAVGDALALKGQGTAAAAINDIANSAAARPLQAGRLIEPGAFGPRVSAGSTRVDIGAWDLAEAAIALAGGPRQASISLNTVLSPLATATLYYAQGQRPAQSPWLTVTSKNSVVVRTAQSRIYLLVKVLPIALLNIGVTLPLYIQLGSAEARLSSVSCPTSATAEARLAVTPSLGDVWLREVTNPAALADFSQPAATTAATLVDALLIKVTSDAHLALGGVGAQTLVFTRADVNAGTMRSVSTNDLGAGIAQSMFKPANFVQARGLSSVLDSVFALLIRPVLLILDPILNRVLALLGIRLGQADVRMNGLICGQPILVA